MNRLVAMGAIGASAFAAAGQIVDFEVPAQDQINPGFPYEEAGFRFSTTTADAAVFPAGSSASIDGGDQSGFFGFGESNAITIGAIDGSSFFLRSLVVGRTSIAQDAAIDVTINLFLMDGTTSQLNLTNISDATTVDFGTSGISSVVVFATDDAGIDAVNFTIPTPSTAAVLGLGALAVRRRR